MNSEFDPPPFQWVLLSTMGGIVTAIALIFGLETLSRSLKAPRLEMPQAPVIKQKSDAPKMPKALNSNAPIGMKP
jgi:hypothetical protein